MNKQHAGTVKIEIETALINENARLRKRVRELEAICDQATTDCIPLLSWVADDDAAVEMVMNIANNLGAATAEGGNQ